MAEKTNSQDQSLTRRDELVKTKTFTHSWLDSDIQLSLIQEITEKAKRESKGSSTRLYVVSSNRFYPDAVNRPFEFTAKKPHKSSVYINVSGPFEPRLACAVAYLEQETSVLIASVSNSELREILESLGIASVKAIGQGIARLTGQIGCWAEGNPSFSTEEIIETVIQKNRPILGEEIENCWQRYEGTRRGFGTGKDSTQYYEWERSRDRLRGFNEGALLLNELLQYPWD